MQNDIEILKFEETPEQNFVGVAHVRLFKSVILRYKVVNNKDATGYFIVAPSYKREIDGTEKWNQWFMLDSQYFTEEVVETIRAYINNYFSSHSALAKTQPKQNTPSSYAEARNGGGDLPF